MSSTPISAASAAALAWLVWRSRDWALVHDAPLLHYVAWLLDRGLVPYRDLLDMNWPGVYLLHWLLLRTGGAGDLAWRLFDLAWLAGAGLALHALARPAAGRGGALAGALLFALYHLAGGPWRAGQRDFLLAALLLAGAAGVARHGEAPRAPAPLAWGGLALGAAATLKPQALLLAAALGVIALRASPAGRRLAAGATLALAVAAPLGGVAGWLAARGGLAAFLDVAFGYVLPLYSRVGRVGILESLGWHARGRTLLALLLLLAALGLARACRAGHSARGAVLACGVAYGWLHYWLQGKGWEYHLYPLVAFLCAAGAPAFGPARPRPGPARAWLRPAVATLAGLALVGVLGLKAADAVAPSWVVAKLRRVERLARDLGATAAPGQPVQVLDVTAGGVHAALRLGLPPATRFMYDFHFFHHVDHPRVRAMRAELLDGLRAGRAALVVLMEEGWPRAGYERIEAFPELAELLARDYRLAVDGEGYRIYAQRGRP